MSQMKNDELKARVDVFLDAVYHHTFYRRKRGYGRAGTVITISVDMFVNIRYAYMEPTSFLDVTGRDPTLFGHRLAVSSNLNPNEFTIGELLNG